MKQIDVKRSTVTLDPHLTHVLARPFRLRSYQRSIKILARVMALPDNEIRALLEGVRTEFGDRQLKIDEFLRRRFDEVSPYLLNGQRLSEERKLSLGGYFTHEYSLEAAALLNPSMVPHPDQSDVPPGSLRFILSLRATAGGHVSQIAFRSGLLDTNSNITMDLPSRYGLEPVQVPDSTFEKALFERKLQELRLMGDFNREALNGLPDVFTMEEPHASISRAAKHLPEREAETKFITLNGPAVENKGIALFPRKIKGLYAMLGRQDAENRRVLRGSNGASWHNENSGRTCTPFVSNGLARSTDF